MIPAVTLRKNHCHAPALILGLLLTLIAGCAARQPMLHPDDAPAEAWARFQETQQASAAMPNAFSLSASLYYSAEGRTNRTILDIWGNRAYPLRLNIRAGIGTTLAHMREDGEGLMVFYPSENKAFIHPDSRAAMPALGLDLPFNLRDLSMLLLGSASRLMPAEYASARLDGQAYVYTLPSGSAIAEVRLLPDGSLSSLAGRGKQPWRIDITEYKQISEAGIIPGRLAMSVPPKQRATLRLRTLSFRDEPWATSALELKLPPQIEASVVQ
ncbi:hypothetical protein PCS_02497 [Desulfocurvibacter africanus PCS]|uniref:Outer-membrane lipoprotein LolB n=1 Tax=Desulfocurvibacter africanus PCS TaxID=1262666 RepID=M5PRU9_DESAF|nr:hypothetical protein [Desulfocurvibacter africanus]EMG36800.1 hypothetical protein PCS_02497 [Desulfocurvibacter africanus PCS]